MASKCHLNRPAPSFLLMLLVAVGSGCDKPMDPHCFSIREIQAEPASLTVCLDPPLQSYRVVDRVKISRKDGAVSIRLYDHSLPFAKKGPEVDNVIVELREGDKSVALTDGTVFRELWRSDKGVMPLEFDRFNQFSPYNASNFTPIPIKQERIP